MRRPAPSPTRQTVGFPEAEICQSIRDFWAEKKMEVAHNPYAPPREHTLHAALPEIDSLEVVRFSVRIEEIIDREMPSRFIQKGGYSSPEEMIRHLLPQLQQLCLG